MRRNLPRATDSSTHVPNVSSDYLWSPRSGLVQRSLFRARNNDLTNTHFEGEALGNAKAKRGKNKQGRSDCPQVVVGMVYDEQGFELAHRTFAGNQSDSTSLVAMVESLRQAAGYPEAKELLPTAKVMVIVDAGVATAGTPKARPMAWAAIWRALGARKVRPVRAADHPDEALALAANLLGDL